MKNVNLEDYVKSEMQVVEMEFEATILKKWRSIVGGASYYIMMIYLL